MCFSFPPFSFFFNDTATTEIYTLSLHDALPISYRVQHDCGLRRHRHGHGRHEGLADQPRSDRRLHRTGCARAPVRWSLRSEEHTSELQSLAYLVCRLLLEKKKNNTCSTLMRRQA